MKVQQGRSSDEFSALFRHIVDFQYNALENCGRYIPLFPLILCEAQGTRPNTLCTAFFMPSWSREVVKYTSWTCPVKMN
jgi:hypothetical protein